MRPNPRVLPGDATLTRRLLLAAAALLATTATAPAHIPAEGLDAVVEGLGHPAQDTATVLPVAALALLLAAAGRRSLAGGLSLMLSGTAAAVAAMVAVRRTGILPDVALPLLAAVVAGLVALMGRSLARSALPATLLVLPAAFATGFAVATAVMPPGPTLVAALLFTASDALARAVAVGLVAAVAGALLARPVAGRAAWVGARIAASWVAAAAVMLAALAARG